MPRITFVIFAAFILSMFASPAMAGHWSRGTMDWESVPRVMYGPGDEDTIRARLSRDPYTTLYRRVLSRANQSGYDLDDHEIVPEQIKANIAKAAAFVYAMDRHVQAVGDAFEVTPFDETDDRLAYGRKAEELLHNMNLEPHFNTALQGNIDDIHSAQELTLYAVAYDLLRGAAYPFEDEGRVAANLQTYAREFYKDWMLDKYMQAVALNNNHRSKSAASLGVAAIVLNGYEGYLPETDPEGYGDSKNWIDFAVSQVDFVILDALTTREGGFAEGGVYYAYTAINHMHFMRALHRYVGPQGWAVDGFEYGDLYTRPENARLHDWMLRARLPNGTFPPHDDCDPNGQYTYALVTDLPHGGLYRWAWENQPTYAFASGSVAQDADAIVAYDDSVIPQTPEDLGWTRNQFLYDAGQAIFRSDWSPDATYLIMMAEHGKANSWAMRRDGEPIDGVGGHEHNEPGGLHLYADGQHLLLDPGYLGWGEHDKVRDPDDHNILLVDGQGPQKYTFIFPELGTDENGEIVIVGDREGGYIPGEDGEAYLGDWFDDEELAYARMDTRYFIHVPETAISRHLLFLRGRFALVYDEAHPQDGQAHDLSILWHGNGGGESDGSFSAHADGGTWSFSGASVNVSTLSAEGTISWEESESYHDKGGRNATTHTRLTGTVNGTDTSFLSLLAPSEGGEQRVTATRAEAQPAWNLDDTAPELPADLSEGVAAAAVSQTLTVGDYTAQARLFYLAATPDGLQHALLIGGTQLATANGTILAKASQPARLWLTPQPDGRSFNVKIDAPPSGEVALWLPAVSDLHPVEVRGACAVEEDDSGYRFTIRKESDFSVVFGSSSPIVHPHAVADILAPVEGQAIEINDRVTFDASRSCGDDDIAYTFDLIESPWPSTAQLEHDGGPQATLVPDRVGDYFVRLSIRAGGMTDEQVVRFYADRDLTANVDGDEDDDGDADGEMDGDLTPEDGDDDEPDGDITPPGGDPDLPEADSGNGYSVGNSGGGGGGCAAPTGAAWAPWLTLLAGLVAWRRRKNRV